VPIFLEKFVLPVLAAGVIAVIVLNPFKIDGHLRAALLLIVIGLAYFVARTIQLGSRPPQPLTPASTIVEPTSIPSASPVVVIDQKAENSTCSNVVAGKDVKLSCTPLGNANEKKPAKHN
jgi:hypothetical protein